MNKNEQSCLLELPGENSSSFLLKKIDSRAKVIAAIISLYFILSSPYIMTPLLIGVVFFITLQLSTQKGSSPWKRLIIPLYMAALAVITQFFWTGQTVLLSLGPLAVKSEGLKQGILIGTRIIAGNLVVLTLATLTNPADLLAAARWFRMPTIIIEITSLVYRYIFLIQEEALAMKEAQKIRLGYFNWHKTIDSTVSLITMVIIRTYDRATRVNEAMTTRGYTGNLYTLRIEHGNNFIFQTFILSALPGLCWLGGNFKIWPF
ncbi:MAG: cobalt ECF transporter T component CbiQ [Dehalococcoidia bacterium]|nr:cobalt ECF transporter T component CbiQ [Dehalococcoidia bacterium]